MLTWALLVSATHMPSFVGAGVAMAQEHREASKRAREARSAWAEGIMDTGGGELQVCPLLVDQVGSLGIWIFRNSPLGAMLERWCTSQNLDFNLRRGRVVRSYARPGQPDGRLLGPA